MTTPELFVGVNTIAIVPEDVTDPEIALYPTMGGSSPICMVPVAEPVNLVTPSEVPVTEIPEVEEVVQPLTPNWQPQVV